MLCTTTHHVALNFTIFIQNLLKLIRNEVERPDHAKVQKSKRLSSENAYDYNLAS